MDPSIKSFWDWFSANHHPFLFINEISDQEKVRHLEKMITHLHNYCENLWFEVGGHPEREQELIITADGDREYFEKAAELVRHAPEIENWKFFALKPAFGVDFMIQFEDIELNPSEMWFLPLDHPEKISAIGMRIGIKNYEAMKGNMFLEPSINKMIDMILGERTFSLDIDYIEAGDLPDDPVESGMMPLAALAGYVEWHKSKFPR